MILALLLAVADEDLAERVRVLEEQVRRLTAPASQPAPPAEGFDLTWMNGQSRMRESRLKLADGAVTLQLYLDAYYAYSGNQPIDNTLTGSGTVGRHNELQVNLISIGAEWNYKNIIGHLSLQVGALLNIVQDLDGTAARGRNGSIENLRYLREATAGYHFDKPNLNIEAGIFMSYIGLESYLLAENWNYTRSLVCDHTPFYFQGLRVQWFPTDKLKIEPWLMNGWQSYSKWNFAPSGGLAIRYTPFEWLGLAANFYAGTDSRGIQDRVRFHHDASVVVRYFQDRGAYLSKLAFSINAHAGFEAGGAGQPGPRDAHMLGLSVVHRAWFLKDLVAVSLRGELFSNPSRYLAIYPPPGFLTGAGTDLKIWGATATIDVMPTDFIAFRVEAQWRAANDGYFAGGGGTTSPDGWQGTDTTGFIPSTSRTQALVIAGVNFRL